MLHPDQVAVEFHSEKQIEMISMSISGKSHDYLAVPKDIGIAKDEDEQVNCVWICWVNEYFKLLFVSTIYIEYFSDKSNEYNINIQHR